MKEKPQVTRIARNRLKRTEQRGFHADVDAAGMTPNVTTQISRGPCPPEMADILEISHDSTIVMRDRHVAADGKPLQLAVTYFPAEFVDKIPLLEMLDTGPGGMSQRMEDAGHQLEQEDIVGVRIAFPKKPGNSVWRKRCHSLGSSVSRETRRQIFRFHFDCARVLTQIRETDQAIERGKAGS